MTCNFYVYEHWRPDRDECFYVGKGKGKRANNMDNRNIFHKAIQGKLARLGMAVEVRMVSVGMDEQSALLLEIKRIAFWRGIGIDLANITNGGDGVSGVPAYNRRPVLCLETGELFVSATHAGVAHKINPTTVSDVCRGKYRFNGGYHYVYENNDMGKKERNEAIKKIEETHAKRRKRVDVNKSYVGVTDGKDAIGRSAAGPSANSKKVICLDDGMMFPSASAAARNYNIARSSIIEMCLGRKYRVTVGGKKFKYYTEDV